MFGITWLDPEWMLSQFGSGFFWVSLAVIVVECGLFFPFLPGDTLLFAMGLFIATDSVDIIPGHHFLDLLFALVFFVGFAFLGNVVGYEIGRAIGPPLYEREGRFLKKRYFDQTSEFFDKHGSKALVIGRFVPFVRTFITVVAGVTRMNRRRFFVWSAIGAVLWVFTITLLGYFLGATVPWLAGNIDYVTLAILAFTIVPFGVHWLRRRKGHGSDRAEDDQVQQEQPATQTD
jgi:membrane-associated protein